MKKKILIFLIFLISLFSLASCNMIEWNEFPTEFITETRYSKANDDYDSYNLYVYINVPKEVFEEAKEYNIVLNVLVYLDIIIYDYNTYSYRTIQDVEFQANVKQPGNVRYDMLIEFSSYLADQDFKGAIQGMNVDSAIYSVSIGGVTPDMEMSTDLIIGVFGSILLAFICYLITVIVLGIVVNRSLTKKYIQIQKDNKWQKES